jgi:hypothetical protein
MQTLKQSVLDKIEARQHNVESTIERTLCAVCNKVLMISQRTYCSRQCEENVHPQSTYKKANKATLTKRAQCHAPMRCYKCSVEIKEGDLYVNVRRNKLYCRKCYDGMRI